jgi:hypothetical protein
MGNIQLLSQHLFYIFGMAFIAFELFVLHSIHIKRFTIGGKNFFANKVLLAISYYSWIVLGLYTTQWLLFLPLFLLSITGLPRNKLWWMVDSIASIVIIISIIINKYLYRYDFENLRHFVHIINIQI